MADKSSGVNAGAIYHRLVSSLQQRRIWIFVPQRSGQKEANAPRSANFSPTFKLFHKLEAHQCNPFDAFLNNNKENKYQIFIKHFCYFLTVSLLT